MNDSPWMLLRDACEYARSSRREVLEALNDGSLWGRQRKAGGTWRTHRDAVDAWLRGDPYVPSPPARLSSNRRSA
jgi:hypothetical protein